MTEQADSKPHDGERWLNLIGYGHLIGQPSGQVKDGHIVPIELDHELWCEQAQNIFNALDKLDPSDPKYDKYIQVARVAFESHLNVPGETA